MSDIIKSAFKAGKVLECLFQDDFQGKTILEIQEATGIEPLAIRRALLTWEELGWVFKTPVSGNKSVRWMVSEKLAEVSASHRRTALDQIHSIEENYKRVTGEELRS